VLCKIDSSGITDLPFVSKDEQLLLERAGKSLRFIEGHYQIALPWKQEMLQLPDNYKEIKVHKLLLLMVRLLLII